MAASRWAGRGLADGNVERRQEERYIAAVVMETLHSIERGRARVRLGSKGRQQASSQRGGRAHGHVTNLAQMGAVASGTVLRCGVRRPEQNPSVAVPRRFPA